jgi:hypothetical protein
MPTTTQGMVIVFRPLFGIVASLPLAAPLLAQMPPASEIPPVNAPTSQPIYPICKPPSPGEYLLLVVTRTVEVQNQVRQTLPASAKSTVCNYLDDTVTRVSGFTTIDTANAWARYLNESAGLSAFVARPTEASAASGKPPTTISVPPATPIPATTTTKPGTVTAAKPATPHSGNLAFNPKPLGTGYAVLVNYFNRPELAPQVQQLLKQNIGLAVYGERPYLLALHTSDNVAANRALQTLTDRGFWAMVVDSRRVTLLKSPVSVQQSTVKN